MNKKREKCAEAGREVRRIQREYLREVAREMKEALEGILKHLDIDKEPIKNGVGVWSEARKAIAKARRLGL